MSFVEPNSFYEGFQINYYDIKQINNRKLLELSDEEIETVTVQLINSSKKEFIRSVKMDIRLTYLLAIETLFEIIFALIPERGVSLKDHGILHFLTNKKRYNTDIRNFSNGEPSKLDVLEEFLISEDKKIPIDRYMFYLGIEGNDLDELNEKITESLKTIKIALKVFAKDLKDRDEINGYKHGLRGFRHLDSFEFGESKDKTFKLKAEDALSFYSFDDESKEHVVKTIEFDPLRDIRLTHFASNILYQIIEPRKYWLSNKIGQNIKYHFFDRGNLNDISRPNVKFQNLVFRYQANNE